jgi:hypothetical protein
MAEVATKVVAAMEAAEDESASKKATTNVLSAWLWLNMMLTMLKIANAMIL